MSIYERFKQATRAQKLAKSNIGHAVRGATTRTSALISDLSNKSKNTVRVDINRRAHTKAIELVADLISSFALPSQPRLEYRGMIKQATDDSGNITSGLVRVGAQLRTLIGHKINIDIPVMIRNSSLLSPSVFFYNDAPYVLCSTALEELMKNGSAVRSMQPRGMYSAPVDGEPVHPNDYPIMPISNTENMYSPGSRNPWTFRRYSSQQPKNPKQRDEHLEIWMNLDKKAQIDFFTSIWRAVDNVDGKFLNNGVDLKDPMHTEFRSSFYDSVITDLQQAAEAIHTDNVEQTVSLLDSANSKLTEFNTKHEKTMSPDQNQAMASLMSEITRASQAVQSNKIAHNGKPRERTNIDTPAEKPELHPEAPDAVLDEAERSREDLLHPGDCVKLEEDLQARNRGGGHIVIPSGEEGHVVRDIGGDGKILYVEFTAFDVKMPAPAYFLRAASVTTDQVQHEIREMIREGYSEVDIRETIARRFPEHAKQALEGL